MPKQKIGKDIIEKKASGLISSPKEAQQFEEWKSKQEEEEERRKKLEEIKERMKDEGEPSDAELIKAKQEEMQKLAEAKSKGLFGSKPKSEEEDEQEAKAKGLLKPAKAKEEE